VLGEITMAFIFRITTELIWEAAQAAGVFTDASLASEGFIHFSQKDQVARTYNRFYKDQPDLVLLTIATEKLSDPSLLIFEDTAGHGVFPHLYGVLNIDAVIEVAIIGIGDMGVVGE
jgi:uncharacterized protein (DUF952 family)